MAKQEMRALRPVAGNTTVRAGGATIKTYGDEPTKHSIIDANWVEQNYAYGAFPQPEPDAPTENIVSTRTKK